MKPYYEADGVRVVHADALDLLASLPDASVALVATDPPYFRVKGEDWDRAWPSASLRAAGWKIVGETGGGTWSRPSRPRVDKHPLQGKLRWEA